jgi:hypothetical protein
MTTQGFNPNKANSVIKKYKLGHDHLKGLKNIPNKKLKKQKK